MNRRIWVLLLSFSVGCIFAAYQEPQFIIHNNSSHVVTIDKITIPAGNTVEIPLSNHASLISVENEQWHVSRAPNAQILIIFDAEPGIVAVRQHDAFNNMIQEDKVRFAQRPLFPPKSNVVSFV